jgi:amino acid adenylation domain-containing protein
MSEPQPRAFGDVLRWQARSQPDRRAYLFLGDGSAGTESLTYRQLDERSRAIATALADAGAAGERVLLLFRPGLDFVAAFLGCLDAGAIAVPCQPPHRRRDRPRLQGIVRDARPGFVLSHGDRIPELADAVWLDTAEIDPVLAGRWHRPDTTPETPAFLQYTSGSTGSPKGVVVTHGNLLHNEEIIRQAVGQTESSVMVSWLPLYHDMGLIGGVLQPLYSGATCVLMPPAAFLQRPLRWLEAISRYRGTIAGGPDFSYDLCVRKTTPEQRAGLDLSSWTIAFNGAEPVRSATLERFAEAFAGCGFRREAFYPCYGLAEATLFVAGGRRGQPVTVETFEGLPRVRHGGAWLGQRIEVVEPDTREPLPDGKVGEVWVSGGSVAKGYWGRPEESAATFEARLAHDGAQRFLRTGDLGVRRDGQLFLCGRLKDLLIVRGRNHHPEDLEATAAASHPELHPGSVAAFAVDGGDEEKVVLVCEREPRPRHPYEEIAEAVRQAVAEEHRIAVHDVVVVSAGGIPRTSSNKVRRQACRTAYLEGTLPVVGHSLLPRDLEAEPIEEEAEPTDETVLRAREIAARVLRVPPALLPVDRPLSAAGLDSLAAAELKGLLETELGSAPALEDLFEISIAEITEIAGRSAAPRITQDEEEIDESGEHPLTDGQRALWFLDRLAPGSGLHTLALAARVTDGLDEAALAAALDHLVRRHAALRARFLERDGEPAQRFEPHSKLELQISDASVAAVAHQPFDLETGPPLRAALVRPPDGGTALVLAAHHLVADFWSLAILLDELAHLYPALRDGLPPPELPEPASYAAHVRRQRERLAGPEGERLEAFWRARLADPPEPLELTPDRKTVSPAGPTEWLRFRLEEPLALGLRHQAREAGTTLFGALLAAFQTLLHRWTGSADFLVGAPASGRTDPRSAGSVGYVMNPLALRSEVADDPSFRELLGRVRGSLPAALAHQEYPAHRLAERLGIGRELFRTLLVYNRSHRPAAEAAARFVAGEPGARLDLGGLELESLPLPGGVADLDLQLYLADAEGLTAGLLARIDRFDAATIERLAGAFRSLLVSALAHPDARLSELAPWTEAERRQILEDWGQSPEPEGEYEPVHERIFEQARRTPDAVAVESSAGSLTYGELARQAAELAGRLQASGVRRGSRVGVLRERTPDLIVALLGVLRAGGAYVPLDPGYPPERISMLLEDAGAETLLTGDGLAATEGSPAAPEGGAATATDDLAYVIFTSGSTGRPKGVMIPHRALAVYTVSAMRRYGLSSADRVLQFTSPAFDASAEEIFPTLAAGATLILRDAPFQGSIASFLAACAERGVTVLDLPTAYWHEVALALDTEELELPASLRLLILGGERALPERWEAWRRRAGSRVRVVNTYGPTEATIVSTGIDLEEEAGELPIGRPVARARVALLGPWREPVPPGAAGEIAIGGAGVARGYLGRPDQTAERFVPDPFAGPDEAGGRLYRTGDLARWRPDGALEFLGRLDDQIKVRGFRVEPAEVEARLVRHPGVRDAAVAARDGRIVAYVLPRGEEAPTGADLGAFLRRTLADFLVPSSFVTVAEIPRTAGGKVDRRRLPEPPETAMEAGAAPRTPEEEVLAAICGEVLGVRRVGRHDDLFELGCHSLLATRIVARARDAFGVELSLARLFESPTVAGLAVELERARSRSEASLPPLEKAERTGDLPLSFPQERLWFLQQLDPESASYHVPRVLRLRGPLPMGLLDGAFTALVERHEVLRTTFPAVAGRPVQRVHPPQPMRIPLVDLSALPAEARRTESERLLLQQSRRTFDLAAGSLMRLLLVRYDEDEHLLAMTEHHLVHDGWTQAVLVRDLLAFCNALLTGTAPDLPVLPVQYADFAVWQRRWLRDEILGEQLAWWTRQLAGVPPVLELPTDRPRPAVQRFHGELLSFDLSAEEAAAARRLARRSGATLFMTLLAAFEALLARATGQTDLVVGTGIANRRIREIEGMLGMVINTLVLRIGLEGDPSFRELLKRVRQTCLDAYAHQDLPFERLVEALRPERSLSHMPLFQVIFAFMDAPMPELALPGLELEPVEVHNRSAKFDLNLTLVPLAEQRAGQGSASPAEAEINCLLEYDADLFDATTMERFAAHWRRLLARAAAEPATPLSELELLAEEERHQVLREWSDTGHPAAGPSLPERILRHAAERPGATAVVSATGAVLSYGELDARSARLARRLRSLGVGPETRVAVLLERSPELVTTLLAVMRAGGAWVPLDPAYPEERLRFALEDSGARALVTRGDFMSRLGALPVPVVEVDDPDAGGLESDVSLEPENLAYVIHTSGSTGVPKGVAVPRAGLENLVAWHLRVHGLGPEDRCTLLAGIGFDASVWELWPTLAAGAAVHVPPPDALALPRRLAAWLAEQEITRCFLPTPLAEEILAEGLPPEAPLVSLLTGGDRLRRGPHPGLRFTLSNHYGPTESSVVATWTPLQSSDDAPPIGRPVDNLRVRLLDRWLAPAPLGVAGEICLGGAGLARGYLGRPDLTAERFVPDPFSDLPGERLYRTGDLARYRTGGDLEFLGRIDDQVKIRGFRIEPAEIESALAALPGVGRALVHVREDSPTSRRLVAWIVPSGPAAPSAAELREGLRARLPSYMVPSAFVFLSEVPRTLHGKVDYRSLPAPEPGGGGDREAPEGEVQETLARIWSEVLGCGPVGARDNLFELGGHSLLAARLLARYRDELGVDLALRQLFEAPTVAELAAVIETARRAGTPAVAAIPRLSRERFRIRSEVPKS